MPDLGMRFWGEIRGKQALERQPEAAAPAGGEQKTSWWQKFLGLFQTSRPPAAEPSLGQSPRSGEAQHIEQRGNPSALGGLQAEAAPPKDLSVEQAKEVLVISVIESAGITEAGVEKLEEAVMNPQACLDREFEKTIIYKNADGEEVRHPFYPEALTKQYPQELREQYSRAFSEGYLKAFIEESSKKDLSEKDLPKLKKRCAQELSEQFPQAAVREQHDLKEQLQIKAAEKLAAIVKNDAIGNNVRSKALMALSKILRDPQMPKTVKWAASDIQAYYL